MAEITDAEIVAQLRAAISSERAAVAPHTTALIEAARAAASRLAALSAWKAEQLQVEAQWNPQAIAALLGMPLGANIRAELQPRIEALSARVKELEAALGPFANAADIKLCGEWRDDQSVKPTDTASYITFGDLRRARAVLGGSHDG